MMSKLQIQKETVFSSDLDTQSKGSDLILEICKKVNAKKYLSGRDGRNYLDKISFDENNIEIAYQNFRHPTYQQYQGGFVSNMSIIDLYFNYGEGSTRIILE